LPNARDVLAKLNRLGVVVVKQKFQRTTTTEVTDRDLLTREEALKVLAGALKGLRQRAQLMKKFKRRLEAILDIVG